MVITGNVSVTDLLCVAPMTLPVERPPADVAGEAFCDGRAG
jgi:hypothetical protein